MFPLYGSQRCTWVFRVALVFVVVFFFPLGNPLQHFAVGILAKHQSWQILQACRDAQVPDV